LSEIQALAERLNGAPGYRGEFHRQIVSYLLAHDGDERTAGAAWKWLRRSDGHDPLTLAVVTIDRGLSAKPCILPNLEELPLAREDYEMLVPWMWPRALAAGCDAVTILSQLRVPAARNVSFRLLRSYTGALGPDEAAELLGSVIELWSWTAHDDDNLLVIVEAHPHPRPLALRLLALLTHLRCDSGRLHIALHRIADRNLVGGWLSRLLRRPND
jgi:hypothetical protein